MDMVLQSHFYSRPDYLDSNAQIIATQDGGYLLAGWTSNQVTATGSKFFIMKLDAGFNELWSATYGTWATLLYVEQTQDGGYILSGYRYSNATGYDMYVVKTDSLGTIQWQKYFGTNENEGGCKVFQLANGDLMLIGLIQSTIAEKEGPYIAKLSSVNGIIIGQSNTHIKNNIYSPSAHYYSPEAEIIRVITIAYNPAPLWR